MRRLVLLAMLLFLPPCAWAQAPLAWSAWQILDPLTGACPPPSTYVTELFTITTPPNNTLVTGATATFSGTYSTVDSVFLGSSANSTTIGTIALSGTINVGDTIIYGDGTGDSAPNIPAGTTILTSLGGGSFTTSHPTTSSNTHNGANGLVLFALAATPVAPSSMKYAFDTTAGCTNPAVGATISGGNWSFPATVPAPGYHILVVCDGSNPGTISYSRSFFVIGNTLGYVGPCDASVANCAAGVSPFFGMRGFITAYGQAGQYLMGTVQRADGANLDLQILANGYADQASAESFAGTDATCTGSISGTTLTIASCTSGTPHVNDQISGSNITDPTYISAIGTCGTPPGTCTVSKSQTAASGTITATGALYLTTWTDQAGAFTGTSETDATQTVQANMPIFLARCFQGGKEACLAFDGNRWMDSDSERYTNVGATFFGYAWINPTTITSGQKYGILGSTGPGTSQGFGHLTWFIDGTTGHLVLGDTQHATPDRPSPGTVAAGTMMDVIFVYNDSAPQTTTFYAGGASLGTTSGNIALGGFSPGDHATAGAYNPPSATNGLVGLMTYKMNPFAGLSSGQIAALHAAGP